MKCKEFIENVLLPNLKDNTIGNYTVIKYDYQYDITKDNQYLFTIMETIQGSVFDWTLDGKTFIDDIFTIIRNNKIDEFLS